MNFKLLILALLKPFSKWQGPYYYPERSEGSLWTQFSTIVILRYAQDDSKIQNSALHITSAKNLKSMLRYSVIDIREDINQHAQT